MCAFTAERQDEVTPRKRTLSKNLQDDSTVKESRSKIWWVIIPCLVLIAGMYVSKSKEVGAGRNASRAFIVPKKSAVVPECVPPAINEFPEDMFTQEERQRGYVVIHILATAYLCLVLAVVCDQYFVPSLEVIAESLNVPVDVAGATFMAIGTSSPELYSAVIGSFVTEGDIGIGTIVGSAVFNILGVTSVTGLLLWRTEAPVDWFPISRDSVIYIFSVATLICVIQDNIVTWFEAALLLTMFGMYIAVMYFNHHIKESCEEKFEDLRVWWRQYRRARAHSFKLRKSSVRKSVKDSGKKEKALAKDEARRSSPQDHLPEPPTLNINDGPEEKTCAERESDDSDSDDDMSPWVVPSESVNQVILWLITWPALLIVSVTIPNCRKPNQRAFPLTFFMSVIWIGIISYLCSWMVTIIGHTFQLPDSVSGITILAAGISVPEIIASVIVVKNGMANMAICNLIGSNIFDILFCLGMPWLIKTVVFSPTGSLVINSSALTYTTATLLSTVVLLFLTLGFAGWKLNWKVGLMCLALYIAFLVVACMCELNVFGDMNPPTCT